MSTTGEVTPGFECSLFSVDSTASARCLSLDNAVKRLLVLVGMLTDFDRFRVFELEYWKRVA